jgi:hypothetical protein
MVPVDTTWYGRASMEITGATMFVRCFPIFALLPLDIGVDGAQLVHYDKKCANHWVNLSPGTH